MPQGRSLVVQALPDNPSVASLPTSSSPDQGPESLEAGVFEDVEDQFDRWVSVAVFGVLTLVLSILILTGLSRSIGHQTLGTSLIALGFLELILGTFGAYVVRPSAMAAVALASTVTIVDGVLIAAGGIGLAWGAGIASMALGLGCAAVGTILGIRTWSTLYRDGVSAS
jgi:hypothetical protein